MTLFLLLALAASAADPYKPLEPLIGTWSGKLKCRQDSSDIKFTFEKLKGGVHYSGGISIGTAGGVLVSQGRPGRYKTNIKIDGAAILQQLGLDSVPGYFSVTDDESDEDSKGNDYYTYSAGAAQLIRFLGTGKLKKGRKSISYQVKTESPLGRDLCSGTLTKALPPKAAKAAGSAGPR